MLTRTWIRERLCGFSTGTIWCVMSDYPGKLFRLWAVEAPAAELNADSQLASKVSHLSVTVSNLTLYQGVY